MVILKRWPRLWHICCGFQLPAQYYEHTATSGQFNHGNAKLPVVLSDFGGCKYYSRHVCRDSFTE